MFLVKYNYLRDKIFNLKNLITRRQRDDWAPDWLAAKATALQLHRQSIIASNYSLV